MLGDKAYDSAELRQWLSERGTKSVVPNRSNRKQPSSFDRQSCKHRHRIENAFCRLKDFRRIAIRYDRLARNFHASACLVCNSAVDLMRPGPNLLSAFESGQLFLSHPRAIKALAVRSQCRGCINLQRH